VRPALPEETILASVHTSLPPETIFETDADTEPASEPQLATELSDLETLPYHVVAAGESLYGISVQHNIRLARLMEWNQLTPEARIKAGDKIWLAEGGERVNVEARPQQQQITPDSPFHQVAEGETLFAISFQYNIRLDRIMAWNNLTYSSRLLVGQKLWLVDPESVEP